MATNVQTHQPQNSRTTPSLLNPTNRPLTSDNASASSTRSSGDLTNRSQLMRRRLSHSQNALAREISSVMNTRQRLSSQNSTRKYFFLLIIFFNSCGKFSRIFRF